MTFAAEEVGQILSQDAQGRVLVARIYKNSGTATCAVKPYRCRRNRASDLVLRYTQRGTRPRQGDPGIQ
jgi:hypothetical protein